MHHFIHSTTCKFLHSHLCSSWSRELIMRHYGRYLLAKDEDRMFVFGFASMHMYGAYLKGLVM